MSRAGGPRIRSLKPEVWQDERFATLGDLEHRLYIGLITQADDEGRGSANLALIRARIFPFDARPPDGFTEALTALQRAGLIQLYEAAGRSLLQIMSWADDQRVDKPAASKLAPPPENLAIPREPSRGIANGREPSRTVSPSRAPADRTGPDQDQTSSSPPNAEARPDVQQLSHLLAELMHHNDPHAKTRPDSKAWRDPIRLLLDVDHRTTADVERVIRWSQTDDFWRTNILSPSKLRQQFPQLLLRSAPNGAQSNTADFSEYDRAAGAAA